MIDLPSYLPSIPRFALALFPALAAVLWSPASEPFGQTAKQAITVTAEVQAAYREFHRSTQPLFFAISTDGQAFGFNFCPTPRPCRRATARANALRLCERNSGGTPCRIYADARRVLWTGPRVIGLEGDSGEAPAN